MKQFRSKYLKGIAILYLGFPVVYLISVAVLFDIPLSKLGSIMGTLFFWFVSAWAIAAGVGLWEMKRWGWYVFLFTNSLVAYQNVSVVRSYSETHHPVLSYFFYLFFVGWIIYLVKNEVRVPYFLPKIRWWESTTRFQLQVPARVYFFDGKSYEGKILDLSIGGVFIKLSEPIDEDQSVKVEFKVFGQLIECSGLVVWRVESGVTRPKGIGIKFVEMDEEQRRILSVTIKRLKRIQKLYRKSDDPASHENLVQVMKELDPENETGKISEFSNEDL